MDNVTAINMLKMRNLGISIPDDVYEFVINSLEELEQYRAIGTVEECREARERQMAKKPILQVPNNPDAMLEYHCPECGEFVCHALNIVHTRANKTNYCMVCGYKLDWGDTD